MCRRTVSAVRLDTREHGRPGFTAVTMKWPLAFRVTNVLHVRMGGELRLLMVAAPGGGKGTQGERLAAHFGVQHVSSGEVLRAEARVGTPAGRELAAYQQRGDLVPDQIVFDLLTPVVAAAAAHGGYILDGFPRTLPQ